MRAAAADAALMALVVIAVAMAASLLGSNASQRVITNAAVMLTSVAALQIFSGNTGIVSFGHAAFMGIGAYTVGILTLRTALQSATLPALPGFLAGHELSLGSALLAAIAAGLITGALTGTALLRLSAASASIATLALLIIVYTVLTAAREVTRGSQPFYGVPRNVGLWIAVFAAIAALAIARVFRESSWGLAARAVSNDEQGAAAAGVDRRVAVFAAWTLSTTIASAAGGLMAQSLGAFTPHTFYFDLAFTMLAMLIIGGMRSSLGALAGVVATSAVIEFVRSLEGGRTLGSFTLPSMFGLTEAVLAISMILIIWRRPHGLCGGAELDLMRRLGVNRARHGSDITDARDADRAGADCIEMESLTKCYAGLTAVDDVSLTIRPGGVTGLIGPNGAGKTTLVNIISGHVAATRGQVRIGARSLQRAAPHTIARAGISRTFQNIRIFPRMTALENVLVAALQVERRRARAEKVALRELAGVGLETVADCPAGSLPPGSQRKLEIARALALGPRFLLLDEPAAGMNTVETANIVAMLERVRRERRLGLLLIEHDLKLVMQFCEQVIVLDRGRVIAQGTPAQVRSDRSVIAAYLGSRSAGAAPRSTESHTGATAEAEGVSHG